MWHTIVGAWLSKAALPVLGGAVAVVVGLSAYGWWTAHRLSAAQDAVAQCRADTLAVVRANQSNVATIAALMQAAERNQQQRDAALREQQAALARITELEQDRRGQTEDQIERVIRVADADACAGLPISGRLRNAARDHADQDGDG